MEKSFQQLTCENAATIIQVGENVLWLHCATKTLEAFKEIANAHSTTLEFIYVFNFGIGQRFPQPREIDENPEKKP
uniref:Photolyase/cryptochrome alpha/beta domain-containing protein n=1 Tax=Steinernema glaseri TaxID=37863 RepID=A0A1I8AK23_9BILA